ncbi:FusB/FusC family EF-G-binding protein [Paucisalibacillus sp. EB02]|uniref:FusB/FusC family EF-G-binding protein n=1 Tax=Paucisalibacillus sp. EB02 TaxID=1347087 RepID=UPI000694B73D|nr:elongation factor G-binding protein [Paucisalibacillus sp. EB02]
MTNKINMTLENIPFLRHDQYNFIKFQLKIIVHAHSTIKDEEVINTVKLSSMDKIFSLLPNLTENQQALLSKIVDIEVHNQAELFLTELKSYVIPFRNTTEKTLTKLFPKVKKFKGPDLNAIDYREISYIGWYDIRSERKFLVTEHNEKLIGFQGTFMKSIKGICSLCNQYEDVGLFMANVRTGKETYTNRGNYICVDSHKCNQNLTTLDKLHYFIELLGK